MSGVTGGWCVDRGGRVRFIKVATRIAPPIKSPRTVEAARRPQFVPTARRAPGEDWSLRSTVCRHQESRESSGEHEVAPCRVRARGLPHASRPRSEPEDGLHRSASRRLLTTPAFPRWSLVDLGPGATRNKLNSSIVTHLADPPSIGPRTGSPPPRRPSSVCADRPRVRCLPPPPSSAGT